MRFDNEPVITYKNKIGSSLFVFGEGESGEQAVRIETNLKDIFCDGFTFTFETPDDFRKWVNQLYKKFGGVTDYIILLAHQNYKKSVYEVDELRVLCGNKKGEKFQVRLELPYCHLIDCYHMKEDDVWERIEDLVDKGYLEYGVNIRYAWLTTKGEAYLKELQSNG